MGTLKIITAVSLIAGSLVAGLFILGSKSIDGTADQAKNSIDSLESGVVQSPIQRSEPVPTPKGSEKTTEAGNLQKSQTQGAVENSDSEKNATRKFAERIVEQIAAKNPKGIALVNNKLTLKVTDPEQILGALSEEFKNIDYQSFLPQIKTDEFVLIQTNNPVAYASYLKSLGETIKKNGERVSLDLENLSLDNILEFRRSLEATEVQLYALPVPSALKDVHARELELVGAEKNIMGALLEVEEDPVRAFSAFRSLPFIINEFKILSAKISRFIKDNGVVF